MFCSCCFWLLSHDSHFVTWGNSWPQRWLTTCCYWFLICLKFAPGDYTEIRSEILFKTFMQGNYWNHNLHLHCAGGLPIESRILPLLYVCRECDRLPCWSPRGQQVSHQRWISGVHCTQVTKHASEGSILTFKPRGDVTKSPKQGYQWSHKNSSLNF